MCLNPPTDKPALSQEPSSHISLALVLSSQNLLVVCSLTCTDRQPHQMARVCHMSQSLQNSLQMQGLLSEKAGTSLPNAHRSVILRWWQCSRWGVMFSGTRFCSPTLPGREIRKIDRSLLNFYRFVFSLTTPTQHYQWPQWPNIKWLLLSLLISYSDPSHYSPPE